MVASELQKSIPLSDQQYSQLQFLFLLAYGLMYAGGGRIVDVLGTRAGYLVMIVSGLLPPAAFIVVMLVVRRIEPAAR